MTGHGDLAGLVGPVPLRVHGLAARGDPGRGWIRRFTFFAGERVEGLEVRSPFRGIPPRRNRAAHRAASAASPRARGRPIRASSPARTDRRTGRRVVRGPRWACSSPPYGLRVLARQDRGPRRATQRARREGVLERRAPLDHQRSQGGHVLYRAGVQIVGEHEDDVGTLRRPREPAARRPSSPG